MTTKHDALVALAQKAKNGLCGCAQCRRLVEILAMPDDPAPPQPTGLVVRFAVAWEGSQWTVYGYEDASEAEMKREAADGFEDPQVRMVSLRLPEPADLVAEVEPAKEGTSE